MHEALSICIVLHFTFLCSSSILLFVRDAALVVGPTEAQGSVDGQW
jgi:hypothetical protein